MIEIARTVFRIAPFVNELLGIRGDSGTRASTATTTTPSPTTTTAATPRPPPEDAMTAAVNMLREAPFETRRRMLAMMMLGVPMTALTMATVGVSAHFIAPLAMVIPGKEGAGFLEQHRIFKVLSRTKVI